jgi:ABC-2 type transport system permease protein
MNALAKFTATEARLLLRDPMTWSVAVFLPTAILLILGTVLGPHRPDPALGGQRFIDLFVPSLLVITLATMSVNTLTIRLATYREKGVLRRLATVPVRPSTLLVAQIVIAAVTALLGAGLLVVAANLAFAVPIPEHLPGFVAAFGLGMAAMLALGLLVGAVAPNASAATGVGLTIFFTTMFVGGVYLPRFLLPEFIVAISAYVPPGVEAIQDAWLGTAPALLPLGIMAVITVVAGAAAARLFRWE